MISILSQRVVSRILHSARCSSLKIMRKRYLSTERDAPVKFSTSPASSWKASLSREGLAEPDDSAWFQPYVVVASVAAFLVYFCILREENDIDEDLSLTIFDRIEGLEKRQLEYALTYYGDLGKDTSAIKKRLLELKEIEKSKKNSADS